MSEKSWYQKMLEKYSQAIEKEQVEPFRLRNVTAQQENAIRGFAKANNFEDLRGFNLYLMRNELTYYDVLKYASPE